MLKLMSAPILLGIIGVVFGIAPILFRSNAVYMLLALCGGEVLARLAAQELTQIINSLITVDFPMYSVVQIVLLVAAPIILLFLYRKTVKADMILQIIPAAAATLLCFMFVIAKLPYDAQNSLQASDLYTLVKPYFGLAIAAGMIASIIWFWLKKPKHDKHHKNKHHA